MINLIKYTLNVYQETKLLYSEEFEDTVDLETNCRTFINENTQLEISIIVSVDKTLVFNSGLFKLSELDKQLTLSELAVEKRIEYDNPA